jgi:recombinational DNA repair protein (RecF pathway)
VSTPSLQRCAKCGRSTDRLFPRDRVGRVCATCYETVGRQRPEWSRLEIAGIAGLMLGSALLVIAVIALLVR